MTDLSREAERTTSEAGSSGVAMAVTQPAWPSRVPRRERVSDIFCFFVVVGGKGEVGAARRRREEGAIEREGREGGVLVSEEIIKCTIPPSSSFSFAEFERQEELAPRHL